MLFKKSVLLGTFLFLILVTNITSVEGASQYIIKITISTKDSFMIDISYRDASNDQDKSYGVLSEHGNQTYN